jgi:hypothetical protein
MLDLLDHAVDLDALRAPRPHAGRASQRPPRHRHWRIVALVALATVLTVGGVSWNGAVTSDPQLRFENANVFRASDGDKTGIRELRNTLGTETRVDFRPGDRFFTYIDLHNGGHHDLRIEAVPPAGFYYWGLAQVLLSAKRTSPFEGGYLPLQPFTLHRGETRYLQLRFRLADCDSGGLQDGASTLRSLPVRYRVLGFHRTVSVPLDSLALAVQTSGFCNHPITDRP